MLLHPYQMLLQPRVQLSCHTCWHQNLLPFLRAGNLILPASIRGASTKSLATCIDTTSGSVTGGRTVTVYLPLTSSVAPFLKATSTYVKASLRLACELFLTLLLRESLTIHRRECLQYFCGCVCAKWSLGWWRLSRSNLVL